MVVEREIKFDDGAGLTMGVIELWNMHQGQGECGAGVGGGYSSAVTAVERN